MSDTFGLTCPRTGASWTWFRVFPQAEHLTNPRSCVVRQHRLDDEIVKSAVLSAGLAKPATPHTLRHALATRLFGGGYLRDVLERLPLTANRRSTT